MMAWDLVCISERNLYILSSEASMLAIKEVETKSKIILESQIVLTAKFLSNKVTLVWAPSHSRIENKEKVDEFVRAGEICQ